VSWRVNIVYGRSNGDVFVMNCELCFQLGRGYNGVLLESLLNLFVVNTSWSLLVGGERACP